MKPGDLVFQKLERAVQGDDAPLGLVLSEVSNEHWGWDSFPSVLVKFFNRGIQMYRCSQLELVENNCTPGEG